MNEAIISFGSNIEPEKNLQLAKQNLTEIATIVLQSSFIYTDPLEFTQQPRFLNGVFLIQTGLNLDELNLALKAIEKKQLRVKTAIKAGPRTVDLDIIVWNQNVIHQSFYDWDFVQTSVLEVKPMLKSLIIDNYE